MGLLHRIAQRCETHDRASYSKTRRLEDELGMEPSPPPASLVDQFHDPDIVDCGNSWCPQRR
ncbi:hypothetical protein PYK79_53820 [Streptomyces sp. ID05-04B]|uniref:hypothetical protein n=1 Tax=unclassified Streptomyces TaxID=2593676 RepID=UPI00131F0E95|nr:MULTISPECIES: hypothetical protein [unclassified Streptomyces]MDX5570393.1 hypothetical protein [Streptomyces sp. ID05-04B]